jgi:negative regulator of flagellin synthesis FlgM
MDARTARLAAGERDKASVSLTPASTSPVQTSDALDPGAVPIDTDRVSIIRKAVETGNYPVVPAKIADAVIAAGLLLRTSQ